MPLDIDTEFPSVNNGWIHTYTGRKYFFDNPDHTQIEPRDISHSLSMICRYNGHIHKFYSVAEHCYIMARYTLELGNSPEVALAALLHDAAEAYVGDVTTPLKRLMGHEYDTIELKANKAIQDRFGVLMPVDSPIYNEVKELDRRILVNEVRELCLSAPDWLPKDLMPLAPSMVVIEGWSPNLAEYHFHSLFEELVHALNTRPDKRKKIVF